MAQNRSNGNRNHTPSRQAGPASANKNKNGNAQNRGNYYNYNGRGYSGYSNYASYGNRPNYSVKNSGSYMSNAGVLYNPGRVRDAERYRERLNDNRKYPNRRRRIITGKELTTPLRRKAAVDAQKLKAKKIAAVKEKITYKYYTIPLVNKKFPVSAVFVVIIITFFLIGLICSYIVLNERNIKINDLRDKIIIEEYQEKILERDLENGVNLKKYLEKVLDRKLENKSILVETINYAVNDLGMVKEDLLQKHYVAVKSDDKAEIVGEKSNIIIGFPDIMSAIFKK